MTTKKKPAAKPAAGKASKPAPKKKPAAKAGKTWQDTKAKNAEAAAPKPADPAKKPAKVKAGKTQAEKNLPRGKNRQIDYTSAEFIAAYDAETAATITAQIVSVDELKREYEEIHRRDLALKREIADLEAQHMKYVRERGEQRGKKPTQTGNLFQPIEAAETLDKFGPKANASGAAAVGGAGPQQLPAGGPASPTAWYPDDLWKQFPIDRLTSYGLQAGDVEKLKAGQLKTGRDPFAIETVGDLSRYTTPTDGGYTRKVTDIKGMGPAGFERLEKANLTFWQEWPSLAEAFAVEKGHRRPDPLAHDPAIDGPAAAAEATPPADAPPAKKTKRKKGATSADSPEPVAGSAGGDRAAGDGHGDGVNGVPGADYRHPSAYIPDAPQEAGAGEVP